VLKRSLVQLLLCREDARVLTVMEKWRHHNIWLQTDWRTTLTYPWKPFCWNTVDRARKMLPLASALVACTQHAVYLYCTATLPPAFT